MDPEVSAPAAPDVPAAPVFPAPVAAPAPPAAPAVAEKPGSMAEAMFGKETAEAADTLRGKGPRDPAGKFVPKVGSDPVPEIKPAVKPAAVVPVAAAPVAPAAVVPPVEVENPDPLAMPEGLTPKAQERFQRLANENRDLTTKYDTATRQVEYVKTKFTEHAVKPEQFEQATSVIGMMNRGDYESARKVLEGQLQQIELITGKKGNAIDALANFPDLREAVDNLQVTEAMALEIARSRAQTYAQGQRQQQEREQQQAQQASQQERATGRKAVDDFCLRMQATDVDYAAIEAQLLPEIATLTNGMHPSQWLAVIEANYRMMKNAAAKFRQPIAPAANALRPTGQASPGQAPRTMHEAMWGSTA